MAFHMGHSEFINAMVMAHTTIVKIIAGFLARTTRISHPAILAVFDSDCFALFRNAFPATKVLGGIDEDGEEEQRNEGGA